MVLFNKKDYWIFGSLLTNKNNMIFDGENGTVTFFKEREIFNSSLIVNYLLYVLIFMSLIGLYFTIKMHSYINSKVQDKKISNYSEKVILI